MVGASVGVSACSGLLRYYYRWEWEFTHTWRNELLCIVLIGVCDSSTWCGFKSRLGRRAGALTGDVFFSSVFAVCVAVSMPIFPPSYTTKHLCVYAFFGGVFVFRRG